MAEIDDGGPAFPAEGGEASGLHPNPGMSLRDWFAGQALAGLLSAPTIPADPAITARFCRENADALIAELKKGGQ